jgi:hypothetical protein
MYTFVNTGIADSLDEEDTKTVNSTENMSRFGFDDIELQPCMPCSISTLLIH